MSERMKKMIDVETSKPLDKALNFNPENIFEYIELILFNINAETISEQSNEIVQKLCKCIESLPISDASKIRFEVEDMVNEALCKTSHYAYKAGFIEACRLIKTLQSF